jgi:alpha-L-rhamnosidase
VLGRKEEEARYLQLAAAVRAAFDAEYVTPAGRVLSDAETAYALALQFDLLKTVEQRQHAGQRLVELVRSSGYHISTGFVGTPLICDALCSIGEDNAAFHLLTQRNCPSWLYPVTMGATTIWERWDSLLPDGSVNPGEMTSFNHYALGAIADWLHRTVGGLAPAAPGYRHFDVRPHPGGRLTSARARHLTPYGPAECIWTIEAGQIEVVVVVPPNATATVVLPGSDRAPLEVGSGTYRWAYPYQYHKYPPHSLDSTLNELIDDPEAWNVIVRTIHQKLSGLARHLDVSALLLQNSPMTLEQVLYLLPQSDALRPDLEAALAGLGR